MTHDELAERLNAWLERNCDPEFTASGVPATSRGVVRYVPNREVRLCLNVSDDVLICARRGERTIARVRSWLERVVEIDDVDEILRVRRDDRFVAELGHAIRHADQFGAAPDCGPLSRWAVTALRRLNKTFGDRPLGPDAAAMLDGVVPRANQRRLKIRRAA